MTPEFSRPFRLDTLGAPRAVAIAADTGERAALAIRFALVAIERLEASATIGRDGDVVRAAGRVRASVVQSCIATGEPLTAAIDAPFDLRFVPADAAQADAEMELDESALDELTYDGGAVDLGEAVAETLSLAIDPFPRSPNADAALRAAGVLGEAEMSPFAKLKGLFGEG